MTRNRDDNLEPSEHAEVLLSLALSAAPSGQDCLPLDTIAAWHDKRLNAKDGAPVVAHLAHCNHCFALWTGLIESESLAASRDVADKPARAWYSILRRPVVGFSAASVVAIAIVFSLLQNGPLGNLRANADRALALVEITARSSEKEWPWLEGFRPRSLDGALGDSTSEQIRLAFQHGVRTGLERIHGTQPFWENISTLLPYQLMDCDGAASCERINEIAKISGIWAVAMYFACSDSTGELHFSWQEQISVAATFAKVYERAAPDDPFTRIFARWPDTQAGAEQLQARSCASTRTLLTVGLTG